MDKKMTVSVIIPTKGEREFIGETIISIQKQTRQPKEIIIVFPEKENEDCWSKLNRGIKQSTTDTFIPLSDDDILDPNYIEKTISLMERENVDIIATSLKNFGDDLGEHKPGKFPFFTSLYTKKIWEKVNGYDSSVGVTADADFGLQCQKYGKRLDLYEPLFLYRVHKDNASKLITEQEWIDSNKRLKEKQS